MQDKPSVSELLLALAEFLEDEIVTDLEGRKRFHAIVAANVARIAAREIDLVPQHRAEEQAELCGLLGREVPPDAATDESLAALHRALCRRIADGDADSGDFRRRVLTFLRRNVARKLAIDDPRCLERLMTS